MARLAGLAERFPFLRLETVAFPPRVIRGRMALARKVVAHGRLRLRRVRQFAMANQSVAIEQPAAGGLSTLHAHFLIRRFFWARSFLQQCPPNSYSQVMLCDVRDVLIQANPFAGIGDELVSGEERHQIRDCPMNRRWIRSAFGRSAENSLLHERILCAGVTLGSRAQIDRYLDSFCSTALAVMRRARTSCLSNLDQAIHNIVLRREQAISFCPSHVSGLIATVGNVPGTELAIDGRSGLVAVMGHTPAVIHQYDRHALLVDHISALHGRVSTGSDAAGI